MWNITKSNIEYRPLGPDDIEFKSPPAHKGGWTHVKRQPCRILSVDEKNVLVKANPQWIKP